MSESTPVVFVDRDGTLMVDTGYPTDPERVTVLDGCGEALRTLQQAGWFLAVVSNQSLVPRGFGTTDDVWRVHERLADELVRGWGVTFDSVAYCFDAPDAEDSCRKPSPRMLLDTASQHGLGFDRAVMIGDKPSDVVAGRRAGCRTVWFAPDDADANEVGADLVSNDWARIATWILDGPGGA